MNETRQLYQLQEIDLETEEKRQRLREIEEQMAENVALTAAQENLAQEKELLAQRQKELRFAEWELDDLQAKMAQTEKRLYGGSVRSPRELTRLEEEVGHSKAQKRAREDNIIELMEDVERLQKAVDEHSSEVETLSREWQVLLEQLGTEAKELRKALANLEARRIEMAKPIPPAALQLYDILKEAKQGRAVARVERGMCQGCRITLPTMELQRARSSLVQCSSCDRILYVG
ncbi:MAG: hypothetical protein HYU86_06885 [Chloroflexi bacterium]|nr:hypothetical protein [Chloroflexota bacterium]